MDPSMPHNKDIKERLMHDVKKMAGRDIAEAAGISERAVEGLCESMAKKGLSSVANKDGQMGFALLPTVPGLFEFPFMKGGGTPLHEKLGELWEEYHKDGLSREVGYQSDIFYPLRRIFVIPSLEFIRKFFVLSNDFSA